MASFSLKKLLSLTNDKIFSIMKLIMLEKKILITCPKCGKRLAVNNLQNKPERRCKCHYCQQGMIIRFGKSAPGTNVPVESNNGDTILPQDLEAMQSCSIIHDGVCHQLSIGVNHIGRASSTCTADIKIDTMDMYMSRKHITITVSRKADGNLEAVLRNDRNKNDTHVCSSEGQEVKVEDCDALVLHHGYRIKMANTEVIFQAVSGRDGDTTII